MTAAPPNAAAGAPPTDAPLAIASRAAPRLFLLGVTLGSALDAIHVHTGTTSYTAPVLFGAAWWVPLEFGVAGIAVGLGRRFLERTFRAESPAPAAPLLWVGLGCFVAAYAVSGFFSARAWLDAVLLAAVFAGAWLACDRTRIGLLAAGLTAAIGVGVEVAMVRAGIFRYRAPGVLGVADWLPLLYGSAAVGIGNLGKHWSAPPVPTASSSSSGLTISAGA
ncbi:MAG TPA: hypothetical protein VG389_14450 [Myxococcota bacterium]|nr:hypothetical protein [Myxococcota bacterium]